MLKLLIADDEKTIRETIRSFINWEALDIEVVGTAKDGIEVYYIGTLEAEGVTTVKVVNDEEGH